MELYLKYTNLEYACCININFDIIYIIVYSLGFDIYTYIYVIMIYFINTKIR